MIFSNESLNHNTESYNGTQVGLDDQKHLLSSALQQQLLNGASIQGIENVNGGPKIILSRSALTFAENWSVTQQKKRLIDISNQLFILIILRVRVVKIHFRCIFVYVLPQDLELPLIGLLDESPSDGLHIFLALRYGYMHFTLGL